MAISIKVDTENDNIITSTHRGGLVPAGHIEITQGQADAMEGLRQSAIQDGRQGIVAWDFDAEQPVLPPDTRPEISVRVNGSDEEYTLVQVGQSFDIELTFAGYDGPLIIAVFDRRFLYNFTAGVATKSITVTESKLYEIKSNELFKVTTPVTIDAVE
jgi:hypothetical protein